MNRDKSHKIHIDCIAVKSVNFALQQNRIPVIRKITLHNRTDDELADIKVTVTSSPDFAYEWTARVDFLPEGTGIALDEVSLELKPEYLSSLTEKYMGNLEITAVCDGEIQGEARIPISLLTSDQWTGLAVMPELLASYIMPNHPVVGRILRRAGEVLSQWGEKPAITGYQSCDPERVKLEISAIYSAIQQEDILYAHVPPSFEQTGQRIRLCDTVLTDKIGNCLDLALLFLSCLEEAGFNGLIVILDDHAFAGCWLVDACFPECVQDDASLLSKRVSDGIDEICLFECTAATAGKPVDFPTAEKMAEDALEGDSFNLFIDVKRSRVGGIRPIPALTELDEETGLTGENGQIDQTGGEGPTVNKELRPFASGAFSQGEPAGYAQEAGVMRLNRAGQNSAGISASIQNSDSAGSRKLVWERKLLDLSLRNTLLNLRVTKNTLQLLSGELDQLEDAIFDGTEFKILHFPKDLAAVERDAKILQAEPSGEFLDELLRIEFENHRLRTFVDEDEVFGRITHLYRKAKLSREENGSNTLFLALGLLKWYETDLSQKARYAPLVLIPVDIVRKSVEKGYIIRMRDEDPQLNITLLEMLRQDFNIQIGGLNPLPADEKGVDLKMVFQTVRQAVLGKSRWEVEELSFLGIFAFSQFIMWNDLKGRGDEIIAHPIVASLLSRKPEMKLENRFPRPEELDTMFSPADLAIPSSADSSQLTAICAASEGNSFVLHGPPGTGKSQTITNIIANMLFQGKTVLFISEKMAALSVVERRLCEIGLGPFSLELHSNKARKKDVLDQLAEVLEIGELKGPEDYRREADRLHVLRMDLNRIAAAVHRKRENGISLYDAISRYEELEHVQESIELSQEIPARYTAEKHVQWLDLLEKLLTAAEDLFSGGALKEEKIKDHPLADFKDLKGGEGLKEKLEDTLDSYGKKLVQLSDLSEKIGCIFELSKLKTKRQFGVLDEVAAILAGEIDITWELYDYPKLEQLSGKVDTVCSTIARRDQMEAQIKDGFLEEIFRFDVDMASLQWVNASASWFLPKALGRKKVEKSLKQLAKNQNSINEETIPQILDMLKEYKGLVQYIGDSDLLMSELFGLLWNKGQADQSLLRSMYHKAVLLKSRMWELSQGASVPADVENKLKNTYFQNQSAFRHMNGALFTAYSALWEDVKAVEGEVAKETGCDFAAFENSGNWLSGMLDRIRRWQTGLPQMRQWGIWMSVKKQGEDLGLESIIEALEDGALKSDQLLPAFQKELYRKLAEKTIDDEPDLRRFNGKLLEVDIKHYKDACRRFEELTRKELAARLAQGVPVKGEAGPYAQEEAVLRRAIRSGGRGMSIRKLFDSLPGLLLRLCPCLLMSPISAAQYIDPAFPKFDLVIFDEASQLPTCEAIGAISRGKNLIVAGDPKQLPPTSFFEVNRIDEDNFEQEDLESILDDCLALSMPETHLLWHYRSRHESLIAFSNVEYYDGQLYTFPSVSDMKSEVEFIPVDGFYDRGKSRENLAEAQAVVEEIVRRIGDQELRKQSMGVVTFNSVQQKLVEDLLEQAFAQNPDLEALSQNEREPIFVKNLENVQGDERDVILFSIGYGPDKKGRVTLNFGPLNREGGWRRLNVAVSRARCKMLVYSTLLPEQIDLTRSQSLGIAGLRSFLEYARDGKKALGRRPAALKGSMDILQQNIAGSLKKMGYDVHINVGNSQFRIDIGILHPHEPGEYILGILCDGKQYSGAATARDRNILQDEILMSLGWKLHRIWVVDWLQDREKVLKAVREAVEGVK